MVLKELAHFSDSSSMADGKEGDGKVGSYMVGSYKFSFWSSESEMLWTFLCRELEILIGNSRHKGHKCRFKS